MKAAPARLRPAAELLVSLAQLTWPALAILGTAALIAAALLRPAPYAVDVGEPGDAYALASFHRPEGTFRWSAPGAALLIPAAYDGPLALTLRLHAPPAAAPAERTLRVGRDGATVAALSTTPEYRVYRLLLPPDADPEAAHVAVERLEIDAPSGYGPGDARPLGVALDELEAGPAPGEVPAQGALGRAAMVAWAAGLGWAAVALVAGWARPAVTALPLLLLGAGLGAWAWRAPLSFAWAAPAPPWWALALGTAALGGWAWARRQRAGRQSPGAIAARWRLTLGAAALVVALAALPPPWSEGAALAATLAPGALAAWALFPEERSLAARVFLGACGSVAVAALLMLAIHALPGPAPEWLLTGAAGVLTLLMAARLERASGTSPAGHSPVAESDGHEWGRGVALALLVGAGLRLWHLGTAEFQGDEARAMLLALGVARGEDGLLLTHTKGPVEALLPAAVLTVAGATGEWAARLPFALASLGVLAGALTLLRSFAWHGAQTGFTLHPSSFLLPASLLAVDGFAVAFGRIVQYQSVVMLMMLGAFWCCWRFYAGAAGSGRHLVAAAALLAVGLLAHYDAAYVAPALAWLVVAGGLRRGWRGAAWARGLSAPVAVGALLLASFYLPYVSSASFAETAGYLAGRAAEGDAGGPPFNNLPLYYSILSFYNAPPLAPLLAGLVLAALAALIWAHVRPRPLGPALAATLIAATLAQWLAPEVYALPGGASWAALAFGLPLAGLCCLPGVPAQVRATAIWFGAAWWAQAFVIAEPRTHFYAAHIPAALLVGLALPSAEAHSTARKAGAPTSAPHLERARQWLAGALAGVVLAVGGAYGWQVFVRQLPEYQRWYPAARPAWLRAPYGDALPEAGYFGFPHRDGWKAAAELYRAGALEGRYDTNQNRWLAGWYLGGLAAQCKGQPDLYLIAEGEPTVYFPPGYHMVAEVTVGPGRALAIYGREAPAGPPRRYALEELAGAFDRRPAAPRDAGALLNGEPPGCG